MVNKIFLEIRIPDQLLSSKIIEKSSKISEQNLTENFTYQQQAYNMEFSRQNEVPKNSPTARFQPPFIPMTQPILAYSLNPLFEIQQIAKLDMIQRANYFNRMNPIYINQAYQMQQTIQHQLHIQNSRLLQTPVSPLNLKMKDSLNMLTNFYEGQCNFYIFCNACKPYILKSESESFVKKLAKIRD